MHNWPSIDIPEKIKKLPKDNRGYPIPYTLYKDENGKVNFSMHDDDLLHQCISDKICGVCGQPLGSDVWLLAGANVAISPIGGYIDPPMHKQCGIYALKVCPYLALPSFRKRSPNQFDDKSPSVGILSGKPMVWGLVKTPNYKVQIVQNKVVIIPERPFIDVEFWREGECIPWSQAKKLIKS